MQYLYEESVIFSSADDGDKGTTKRVLCIHAGLSDSPLEEQLDSLKQGDFGAPVLQQSHGRLDGLCERRSVTDVPEALKDKDTIVMSGHHGHRSISHDRIILDRGGGKSHGVLEAIILPDYEIVGHTGERNKVPPPAKWVRRKETK
jgi:hypothetical protein